MPKIIEPYEHDCDECQWVGWFSPWSDKPPMNIYLCDQLSNHPTVIIRFSSNGPDYWAMPVGITKKGPIEITDKSKERKMPKNPAVNFTFNEFQFRLEEYDYSPGIPGRYSGPPEHCFPPEPPELEPVKLLIEDFTCEEGMKEIPIRAVDLLLELHEDLWNTMLDSVEEALRKEEPEYEPRDPD